VFQYQPFSPIVLRSNAKGIPLGQPKIEMRLFILYNLQLEIFNFLTEDLSKAAS
jgi:hypothetical protein